MVAADALPGRVAFVFGAPLGVGGLGVQSMNALRALARGGDLIDAIGPESGPRSEAWAASVTFHAPTGAATGSRLVDWANRRWRTGAAQLDRDRAIGAAAVARLEARPPRTCYAFTQVALEVLRWAKACGVPTVLESPNGHLERFRDVCVREASRWCGGAYTGHPSPAMVERVLEEYSLADRIRVSSGWARDSLIAGGVDASKIAVLQQPVDLERYAPGAGRPADGDTVRACFVGSLDLRKGFPYLLEAMGAIRELPVSLHFVGATGDRCCRRLLRELRQGLPVTDAPGDPRPSLAAADLFVLPTLEDGSPFAVAEAMACGLPVVTTTATGAAEWVVPDTTGWIVPPGESAPLAETLARAVAERSRLASMGRAARADTVRRAGPACDETMYRWFARS